MTLHQSLSNVLALADKATAGEWSRNTIMPDKDGEANADFICSAVNLLRTHGPALLALAQMVERPVAWHVTDKHGNHWGTYESEVEAMTEAAERTALGPSPGILYPGPYHAAPLYALPPAVSKG